MEGTSRIRYEQVLETERTMCAELITSTDEAIQEFEKGLTEYVKVIKEIKPDSIVMLDKGARILGVPTRNLVSILFADETERPEVLFYNDSSHKDKVVIDEYVAEKPVPRGHRMSELFEHLRGQRVLFVDEVMFRGDGAKALNVASAEFGIDGRYFTLLEYEFNHRDELVHDEVETMRTDGKLHSGMMLRGGNEHVNFFGRAQQLYISEETKNGETVTVPNYTHLSSLDDVRHIRLAAVKAIQKKLTTALTDLMRLD